MYKIIGVKAYSKSKESQTVYEANTDYITNDLEKTRQRVKKVIRSRYNKNVEVIFQYSDMSYIKLKEDYENAVNAYVKAFEEKHELKLDFWVADKVGEIGAFGDCFFNFSDIKTDIDTHQPKDEIFNWYDLALKQSLENKPVVNYNNYICGLTKNE